jgi:hypothetical protein
MEPITIASLILNIALIFERMFKHIKKSSCFGVNIENTQSSESFRLDASTSV